MRELFALNIYFRRYAAPILFGILCVILNNIAAIYIPVLVRSGFDDIAFLINVHGTGAKNLGISFLSTGIWFGVAILIAASLKGLFMYIMRQKIIVVSRHIEYDLKNDIYHKFQKLPAAFYRTHQTGDLMARVGEDVSNVRMYVGPAVMYLVNVLFTFITVIFQMYSVNPVLASWALLPLPFLSFGIYKVSTLIHQRNVDIQTQLSAITTSAQETFAGIRVIKAFGAEHFFQSSFFGAAKIYRRLHLRLAVVNALFFPLMLLLVGLSSLSVLYFGGKLAIEGALTTGNIAEFILYLNMLIWPVASLGYTTALVQKAAASQKRINEYLDWEETNRTDNAKEPVQFDKEISFQQVSLTYPGKTEPAVSKLDFTIPKGKILGITGHTGSGKSTIAHLLTGVYSPDSGTIRFDGMDQKNYSTQAINQIMSYVPQDVFLFSDSIEANILFGKPAFEIFKTELDDAVNIAALTADLQKMPDGMATQLGERGITLSGGQKQRVSIARAVYRNAELFVMDDCLSAVDTQTESKIMTELKTFLTNKTAVIISHRASTLSFCDNIMVLENGKIAEYGTQSELLHQKSKFFNLVNAQNALEKNPKELAEEIKSSFL